MLKFNDLVKGKYYWMRCQRDDRRWGFEVGEWEPVAFQAGDYEGWIEVLGTEVVIDSGDDIVSHLEFVEAIPPE